MEPVWYIFQRRPSRATKLVLALLCANGLLACDPLYEVDATVTDDDGAIVGAHVESDCEHATFSAKTDERGHVYLSSVGCVDSACEVRVSAEGHTPKTVLVGDACTARHWLCGDACSRVELEVNLSMAVGGTTHVPQRSD